MDQLLGADLAYVCALCKQGYYDYIIVGSGMGGGVLARTLVSDFKRRVLLIERGGVHFTTHCLNTSRPHWNFTNEGGSQDHDMIFRAVKQPVQVVSAESRPYVGGPVHCLGGRSNVWGLYLPQIERKVLDKYFPNSIVNYLTRGGYNKAYQLLCNDPNASMNNPYPLGESQVDKIITDTCNSLKIATGLSFACASLAAEFTPRDSTNGVYTIPQGAFSTVEWLLDRLYNKDELLTVLLNTEIMSIEASSTNSPKSVSSLVVRQNSSEQRVEIPTSNVKATILCAGTIDTPVIALRSGLQAGKTSVVGKGLNDHSVFGSRIAMLVPEDGKPHPPLKLEGWWTRAGTKKEQEENVLVHIVVNASSFLGSSADNRIPTAYFNFSGAQLNKLTYEKALQKTGCCWRQNIVQVNFEYTAPLIDENAVLNAPVSVPVIRISSVQDETSNLQAMEDLVVNVRRAFIDDCNTVDKRNNTVRDDAREIENLPNPRPQLVRGGFGEIAHEVGTMRMEGPTGQKDSKSVVDSNLKVKEWKDLFVCDLSVFPVSPASNPSLTLVALAQRLGGHLNDEYPCDD